MMARLVAVAAVTNLAKVAVHDLPGGGAAAVVTASGSSGISATKCSSLEAWRLSPNNASNNGATSTVPMSPEYPETKLAPGKTIGS